MKKILASLTVFAICLFSTAAFADKGRTTQVAHLNDLTGTHTPASQGAATLKRTKRHLEARIMGPVDQAGIPYTVWWVIFNHPGNCLESNGVVLDPVSGDVVTNCSEADLFVDGVGGAVINASGAVSASNGMGGGVINMRFELNAGDAGDGTPGSNLPCCFGKLEKKNGKGAEVHLVVNEHLTFDSWPVDLTTPEGAPYRGAVFVPLQQSSHDDD